jgi:hypothetical protein
MKFLGKYGEHRVLVKLLERDIEAYPAIKINQDSYDITAVISPSRIARIQVKSTDLNNKSTNNQVGALDREFDYLVVMVVAEEKCRFFVLSRDEALRIKGTKKHLPTSRCVKGIPEVMPELLAHEDKWEVIR